MIDQLTDYLTREAARVQIDDGLADIEAKTTRVPVRHPRRHHRWIVPTLLGTAAAAVALIGLGALDDRPRAPVADGVSVAPSPSAGAAAVPVEPAAPSTTTPPVRIPLPDGATMQGFVLSCSTGDGIEFDCTAEGYRTAGGYDDLGIDHTGEVQAVITADSIVSGGCRATSPDGSSWHCAVGPRAVEMGLIGPEYLGSSETPGYAAG